MKILLADKQQLFRDGVKLILGQCFHNLHVVESEDFQGVIHLLKHCRSFDLVLVELELPGNDDLFGIQKIRQLTTTSPIIVLSSAQSLRKVDRAFNVGVKAFISKSTTAANLLQAVDHVTKGCTYFPNQTSDEIDATVNNAIDNVVIHTDPILPQYGLTARQEQILNILSTGATNNEIAYRLAMKEATVRKHLTTIYRKINVTNRSQATRAYLELKN